MKLFFRSLLGVLFFGCIGLARAAAPVASLSGSVDLLVGVSGSWDFGASDSDGNLSRWRFHSSTNPSPQWSYISGGSVSGSYSTAFSEEGDYVWVVDVEDGTNGSDTTTLTVHVHYPNSPPSAWLDLNPDVVLTNGSVGVTAHAHDDEGRLYDLGVRWWLHDLRQWWDVSGDHADATRSYTETMSVQAGTEYFRGEAYDIEGSGTAGDWQPVVVLGTWLPAIGVTPVTPPQSGSVTVTFADAPDAQTLIGIYHTGDSNGSPMRSAAVGHTGNGAIPFALGSGFVVGQSYEARMFPMGNTANAIATSNSFLVTVDNPTFALAVSGGAVGGRTDEDGNSQDGVFHTSGWHSGDVVGITATPASGQTFDRWSMNGAGNGTIGNPASVSTTFTIGTTDGAVQAMYQNGPALYLVTVNGGHAVPAGPQPSDTHLVITADVPDGQAFQSWTLVSGPGSLSSTSQSPATFTVGAGAATVTASFANYPAPVITSQPVNHNAPIGTGVTFTVAASGAGLSYQWRKDGVAIADGGSISGTTSASLTINSVQDSDAANYDVVVTNPSGTVTSSSATLAVFGSLQLKIYRPL